MNPQPDVGVVQAFWTIWGSGGQWFLLAALLGLLTWRYFPQVIELMRERLRDASSRRDSQRAEHDAEVVRLRDVSDRAVQQMVQGLQRQVDELRKDLVARDSQVQQLYQHVRECDATVASQAAVIARQDGKLMVMEAQITSLNTRVSSLTGSLERMRARGVRLEGDV